MLWLWLGLSAAVWLVLQGISQELELGWEGGAIPLAVTAGVLSWVALWAKDLFVRSKNEISAPLEITVAQSFLREREVFLFESPLESPLSLEICIEELLAGEDDTFSPLPLIVFLIGVGVSNVLYYLFQPTLPNIFLVPFFKGIVVASLITAGIVLLLCLCALVCGLSVCFVAFLLGEEAP